MALKDHPFFFVCSSCVATAVITWTVSENLRVVPISERLTVQESVNKYAPVIKKITLSEVSKEGEKIIEQNIEFFDRDGDAFFINYLVIGSDIEGLNVNAKSISTPKEKQLLNASEVGTWNCGKSSYFVQFRAYITDRSGHISRPYDYTINCNR